MSNKRRRTDSGFVRVVSTKRPIDKGLIVVNKSVGAATQANTLLVGATFPCTVTGLRWSLGLLNGATSATRVDWAIVIVRDGLSASTMSQTDAASLYQPEQDVMAFGSTRLADLDAGTGPAGFQMEGSTKSMRKLMGGDALVFIVLSETAMNVDGVIQVFCKS